MLEDLLEEEELLQECKGHNRRLCEYLSRPETVQKLFEHILRINDIPPPDTNVEPDPVAMKPAKYSFISCEVFLCEIYDLFDTVFRDATILDKLFGVLSTDGPLPPIVPIYFYKCLLVLLQKRAFDTLAYMETRPNLIQDFIKHINNPIIKDALLAISFLDESSEGRSSAFLLQRDFFKLLIAEFEKSEDIEVHENIAHLLSEIISQLSAFSNAEFANQLQSEEFVDRILSKIVIENPTRSLQFGLNILIEILEHHAEGKVDPTPDTGDEGLPGNPFFFLFFSLVLSICLLVSK